MGAWYNLNKFVKLKIGDDKMLLYKYRTDSEWTEEIISKNQVWFAKPETLNDPLECAIQEIAQKSISECCQQEKTEQLEGFVFAYVMTPKEK